MSVGSGKGGEDTCRSICKRPEVGREMKTAQEQEMGDDHSHVAHSPQPNLRIGGKHEVGLIEDETDSVTCT